MKTSLFVCLSSSSRCCQLCCCDEGRKNCKFTSLGFTNRESWKNCQDANQACKIAKQLLTSGKPPPKAIGKNTGEYWNDVHQYCRDANVAKDGLLVVKSKPDILSGNIPRERIVIPKPLVPALLYHLHNHDDGHPAKTQQKQRQFYAIHLDKHLELLYRNCYQCSVIQKIPKEAILNETKTNVSSPHSHFHADVIKRSNQNILILVDHFSTFQDAMFLDSEKATNPNNKTFNCSKRNIVYKSVCLTCKQKDEIEKKDDIEEHEDAKDVIENVDNEKSYWGESHVSGKEGSIQHSRDFANKTDDSHQYKHFTEAHRDMKMEDVKFGVSVVRQFYSSFSRQIFEAVLIFKYSNNLNSKSMYNRSKVPRLNVLFEEQEVA